ncbi:alpha/beta fold hydrolase [Halalkalibaculum sp. DA384]|uniref:alpha/beta fold hydrolase n=1 Tax=Halalkalibaculum sp. DA384 TaxID=3373606 RepID=UPI0037543D3C
MKRAGVTYLLVLLLAGCSGNTEKIPAQNAVAELISTDIGGMQQWLLIRGENNDHPVLLWLHGGPGSAQMPIHHAYTKELEKEFIVVHWDQRGAGKSNTSEFREKTMTLHRFIEDTHELTGFLKKRFGQEQIYLLGHSWDTLLGIHVVKEYPDDYEAFISVSQVVDPARADSISWSWLQEKVQESGSQDGIKALDELGGPPFEEHERFVRFIQLVDTYGGGMDAGFAHLLWKSLGASEYTLTDYIRWFKGANRGSGPMCKETRDIDLFASIDSLGIPVYFFTGVKDYNTPHQLVNEYYDFLQAPQGKYLVRFTNSAHTPFIAEPEKFNREVVRVKQQTERPVP